MISSKELLEKTGISRATLNNYISAGLLSFGAGAFVYVDYPKWSTRPVAEISEPAGVSADNTPPVDRQATERPTATNGQRASSGTTNEAPRVRLRQVNR